MKISKKSRWLERLLVVALLAVIVFQIGEMDSQAATAGWSLRYAKGAPTSTQKTAWSKTAKTKQAQLSMKVSSFSAKDTGGGNNGWVYLKTTKGGISSFANKAVTVKASSTVKIGTSVTGSATITNTSNLNSCNASGSFIY